MHAWDAAFSREKNLEILDRIASSSLSNLPEGNHHRTVLSNYVRRRQYRELVDYKLTYDDGRVGPPAATAVTNAEEARWVRQALACYQKNASLDLKIDREAAAYEKFVEAERLCKLTNAKFALSEKRIVFPPLVDGVIYTSQQKISEILGFRPPLRKLKGRFGPGASIGIQKRWASARRKLSAGLSCSEALVPHLPFFIREFEPWFQNHNTSSDDGMIKCQVSICPGTLSFVAKNAKTDRGIVVEPLLNSVGQLGVGDYISDRLRNSGIDLRDQTRNQRLALRGSLDGRLATVDLSSASDTVSVGLVKALVPPDWFDLLCALRTSSVRYKDELIELEKFSSMGNGYTFALESLVFFSLAWSVCDVLRLPKRDVSVYGDDIIVPSDALPLLTQVLNEVGFQLNADKSFGWGPFRESCGTDYFCGIDVRPAYVKDELAVCDLFVLHNSFVADFWPEGAEICLENIPKHLRLFGPPEYGDGHLHTKDWCARQSHRDKGWGGYVFDTFTFGRRLDRHVFAGDYLFPAYSVYLNASPEEPKVRPRMRDTRHAHNRRILVNQSIGWATGVSSGSLDQTYNANTKKSSWCTALPGKVGYKKRSIYTLIPPDPANIQPELTKGQKG